MEKYSSLGFPNANVKWFEGGKLNITANCLDRHLEKKGAPIKSNFDSK